ncbi:unnamed protein product [Rotaria sordida]|uniref:Uncharacterized protein n=1 Tax=Rotaria sordida TaxID=392033 RepID=A0A815E7J5_9BILA|nr:unnamed protein product [Rotaria sordida]
MSAQSNSEEFSINDGQRIRTTKENVEVSSSINHDARDTVQISDYSIQFSQLMDRLSKTHSQIDQYTQTRTNQISVETEKIIKKILEETEQKQKELLLEAQMKSQLYQEQYQNNLQMKVNQLNEEKAQELADLEQNLNQQQELILTNARNKVDLLQTEANQRKMNILQQGQQITNSQLEEITGELVEIGRQDSEIRLASTTTTIIATEAVAQQQPEPILNQ